MPITKNQAIKALDHLFERAFGSDKGSREAYEEWLNDLGMYELWDEDDELDDNRPPPPGTLEFLLALGVTPKEIVDVLHINPEIFDVEVCTEYGMEKP